MSKSKGVFAAFLGAGLDYFTSYLFLFSFLRSGPRHARLFFALLASSTFAASVPSTPICIALFLSLGLDRK